MCQQTNPCHQNNNPCGQQPCTPLEDCSCPIRLNSECVTYNGDNLECSGIETGLDLNQTLQLLDAYICDTISQINNSINLINIGNGLQVYAGIDALGRRKIRTLTSNDDSVVIELSEDGNEIDLSVGSITPPDTTTYSSINVGTGVGVYKNTITSGDNKEFNFRTLTSNDDSVVIELSEDGNEIDLSVENVELGDGATTIVNGDGIDIPYSVEVVNLQKNISTFPYTITALDDKYTIFVNPNNTKVIIYVQDALPANFSCSFIQTEEGEVAFEPTGTANIIHPIALQNKIKGKAYWAMIEKNQNTTDYYLVGSLKIV